MATGAIVASTAISIFGGIQKDRAQRKAANAKAHAARQQAEEVLKRAKINIDRTKKDAAQTGADQVSAFVAGGVDITSGATLLQASALQEALTENIMDQQREAEYNAAQVLAGGDVVLQDQRSRSKANKLSLLGEASSGGGRAYTAYNKG